MQVKSLALVAGAVVVAAGGVFLLLEVRGGGASAPAVPPPPPKVATRAPDQPAKPLLVDKADLTALVPRNPLSRDPGAPRIVRMPDVPKPPPSAVPTVTTPSGLQYQDTAIGDGPAAAPGQVVRVHYTSWLDENGVKGKQIDDTVGRAAPISFRLGEGNVIAGLDEGLAAMKPGGKRTLVVPAHLAYGQRGAGQGIPPGSVLRFEVQLLEVRDPSTPPSPR